MEENKNNNAIALKNSNESSISLSAIKTAEDFERIVDFVANSEIYNKTFTVNSEEDGKPVRKVDKNAIATCLMLGSEIGFKPIESIMLGRRLNDEAVIKVYRGKDFGLNPISALQNIHVWKSNDRELVYTGIHIIYKALTDAGVKMTVIDDGTKPFYYYVEMKSGDQIELDDKLHILMNTGLPTSEIEEGLKSKKMPVLRKTTRRGLVELYRKSNDTTISIPYTLIQAVDAGLYKGINSFGEEVKGKDNWNKHPATHLIKMSVMNGARMIIGDKLQGAIYIAEELPIVERAGKHSGDVEDGDAVVE